MMTCRNIDLVFDLRRQLGELTAANVGLETAVRQQASIATSEIEGLQARVTELEGLLTQLYPAAREILWCALVWNDHNFRYDDLTRKAHSAAKALGFEGRESYGSRSLSIDLANAWIVKIEKALGLQSGLSEQEIDAQAGRVE